MDRGIWATWYDLPESGRDEYIDYLHGVYLPAMLQRPGYLWAAHVQNIDSPEREAASYKRLVHTEDPSVPQGYRYLLLFGAADPHVFVAPAASEIHESLGAEVASGALDNAARHTRGSPALSLGKVNTSRSGTQA